MGWSIALTSIRPDAKFKICAGVCDIPQRDQRKVTSAGRWEKVTAISIAVRRDVELHLHKLGTQQSCLTCSVETTRPLSPLERHLPTYSHSSVPIRFATWEFSQVDGAMVEGVVLGAQTQVMVGVSSQCIVQLVHDLIKDPPANSHLSDVSAAHVKKPS